MDQRGNQPMDGMGQPTGSLRPPVGYPPQSTGRTPYVQAPPYPPQQPTGYAPVQPPMQPMPPQSAGQPPYPPQQPMPQDGFVPPAGFMVPPGPVRPPRRPSVLLKLAQVLAVVLVLGATVWYLYEVLVPDYEPYGVIESDTLGAVYTGDCVIVRDEVPYDAEGVTSVNHLALEATTVRYSSEICEVYSSGYSTREMNTLQDYRDAIRNYQKTLLETETTYDARMTRLQSDVVNRAKEIRAMIAGARGSLTNQQNLMEAAVTARQQYLRSFYADDQRLSRLYDDETSQLQRIQSWTKKYVSSQEAIVSFYSDAYEYGLNSQNYMTFTPSQVRAMFNGQRPESATNLKGKTTIYRLIQDGSWNVLFLSRETDWNPIKGETYELKLERFQETTVTATVEDFVRSGGELLLQLSVRGPVNDVLYMRTCQAELGESISTLKVPERAIYQQDGMEVVVVVSGGTEGFVPVNVLRRSDGYAFITPVQQGLLFEGQTIRLF
ncbi:MAG: hypothetical protein J1E43_08015 [Christensenellaceae bacterium]|nr:hypothetical protein [Christensenellaceae bacterium]